MQEEGCVALGSLAFNADNSVQIVVAGGIGDVLTAMREHKSNVGVQEECCCTRYANLNMAARHCGVA